MSSSPDKLMDQIEAAYTRRGYSEKALSQVRETFHNDCDRMGRKECVDYLRMVLLEVEKGDYNP
jgi:hypothetical protein